MISTKSAEHFIQTLSFPEAALPVRRGVSTTARAVFPYCVTLRAALLTVLAYKTPEQILKDEDEWSCWSMREDPVLHIDLRRCSPAAANRAEA